MRLCLTLVVAISVGLLGCASESGSTPDAGDAFADRGDSDAATSDLQADTAPDDPRDDVIELPDAPRPLVCPGDFWVTSVSGRVVAQAGEPLEAVKVQLCIRISRTGRLLCLSPADSGPNGEYVIIVPEEGRCQAQAVMRVILPLTNRATTYCRIDLPPDESNVTLDEPLVLFETTPASELPAEGDPAAERTVVFEDGLEIDVVPERLFLGGNGYAALASRRVDPQDPGLCFVDNDLMLDGLYAFSPEGDVTGDSLRVRVPVTGVDAGTTAMLYVLGALNCTLPDGASIEEGDLHPFGTGVVDPAGQYLVGSGDGGLPCFSWLGYRFE